MTPQPAERGYAIVDVVMGLVLFALVIVCVYRVFIPAFTFSREAVARLSAQQDVRLALDRVARQLHETTLAFGRTRMYTAETGCTDAYEGCIGFVTARSAECGGPFQLASGAPDWQATLYVWRDTASNELRMRCDATTAFPVTRWPPPALAPYRVVGVHVTTASFTLGPEGSALPLWVAVALQEEIPAGPRRAPTSRAAFANRTVFVPENR